MFSRRKDPQEPDYDTQRRRMVEEQIVRRGVHDTAVLEAVRKVPRHLFIPEKYRSAAYADGPQPIGEGQTISQPYIVASMTEELELAPGSKVLEIGTGSGYQTAVLAEIAAEVYTIEIIAPLADSAKRILNKLGYKNIFMRLGDGSRGWPEAAPFDGIIITAAAPRIPDALPEQLAESGRMIVPVGESVWVSQNLVKLRKTTRGIEKKVLYPVRFVAMHGEIEE
jgi:protein-L-isoaspartate(D-aspartate) O-methyltransferase